MPCKFKILKTSQRKSTKHFCEKRSQEGEPFKNISREPKKKKKKGSSFRFLQSNKPRNKLCQRMSERKLHATDFVTKAPISHKRGCTYTYTTTIQP